MYLSVSANATFTAFLLRLQKNQPREVHKIL